MRKLFVATIACLSLCILGFNDGRAAEPLLQCGDDPVPITIGSIIDCEITQIGDTRRFQYDAPGDEMIILTMTDKTPGSPHLCLTIYDPDSAVVASWCVNDGGTHGTYDFSKKGTYTFIIREYGDDQAVDFRLALQSLFPAPPEVRTLFFDNQYDDNLDPFADSDIFIFKGYNGSKIRLVLNDFTGGSPYPCLVLYDPAEASIDSWCANDGANSSTYDIAETGDYTILVWEYGDNQTDDYRISLDCILGDCPDETPRCGGIKATVTGTEGDNVIIGSDLKDVIVGLGGNDIIYGLDGNDRICGGDGNDTIYGDKGNDKLWGDSGHDVLYGHAGKDRLFGDIGNDTLIGGGGDDELNGGGTWGEDNDSCYDDEDTPFEDCEVIYLQEPFKIPPATD